MFGLGKKRTTVPDGYEPMGRFSERDIFIVGYPKSGNTWFQNLAAGVVFGVNPEFCSRVLVQDLIPDVHFLPFYRRYATPMYFKSHFLPQPEYKRVVYLLRDGRDATVSYFHHRQAVAGKEVDFLDMVRNGSGLFPGKWHEHVEAWNSNPHRAEMMVIRYEDLKKDPHRELEAFCKFAGLERTREFLQGTVDASTFDKMRRKEVELGPVSAEWPKDKFFIRRGAVGSYRDEMAPEVLEAFLNDASATLRQNGYLSGAGMGG